MSSTHMNITSGLRRTRSPTAPMVNRVAASSRYQVSVTSTCGPAPRLSLRGEGGGALRPRGPVLVVGSVRAGLLDGVGVGDLEVGVRGQIIAPLRPAGQNHRTDHRDRE